MPAHARLTAPLLDWRVRSTHKRYRFYRLESANPFQAAIYQLQERDPANGNLWRVIGLFDRAQYEARVHRAIGSADCEITS